MSTKNVRRLKYLLLLCSVLAAVKSLFTDYTMDEEYQIVMAYRRLSGDTLFGTMWEPHQTSAFVCVWLMGLFRAVTGGVTGVVLFLRFVTLGIQAGLSVWLTADLRKFMERDYAFLLGCCYFNIVPKLIQIPDFSNLQLWFFTVTVLSLLHFYDLPGVSAGGKAFRKIWLALAGAGMALGVLAYPSGIFLFPLFLAFVVYRSGKRAAGAGGWAAGPALGDGLLFGSVCGLCAAVWLCAVLSKVPWGEFLKNIRYVIDFDLTHDLSLGAEARTASLLRDGKTMLIHMGICGGIGWAASRAVRAVLRRRGESPAAGENRLYFAVFFLLAAEAVQLYYWVVLRTGYEAPQVHILAMYLAAVLLWRQAGSRKSMLSAGILGGALTILATIYMSDLGIYYSVAHGVLGAVFSLALLVCALERKAGTRGRTLICLLLFVTAFFTAFGKGYTLRAGRITTVPQINGLIREGPAAGIFTSYIQAYAMNRTYEEFAENVRSGENCLIVTNVPGVAGTTPYLFRDLSVCHFSVVDPTSYDERLLTYWECYPEKQPDLIVVDCWFGKLKEDPDSWIMQYIENDFGYREAIDGTYVRFYRK